MKKITILSMVILFFSSCTKEGNGVPNVKNGLLPTNYIIVKDNSFSPKDTTMAVGNSFTFVNQSTSTIGIYSVDSVVINKQGMASNTSYFFKKDTVGTIYFFMAGKPTVRGSITLIK